jgi:hypothetical protein
VNWEGSARNRSGHNLRYYPKICLEELRKITRNLSQNSRSQGRDLIVGPLEYKAGVPTAWFQPQECQPLDRVVYVAHPRGSSNMVTGYGLDHQGSTPIRVRGFPLHDRVQKLTHSLIWEIPGPSPEAKRPECEANVSRLLNAKVKSAWSCTSTPHTPQWRTS